MTKKKVKNWCQIEIEDIDSLSGKNLNNILNLISDHLRIKKIVIEYLDGPFGVDVLKYQSPKIISLKKFINISKKVSQFEWGYFYLFDSKKKADFFIKKQQSFHKVILFNKLIPFVDVVICAFDNMSFIIYTNNPEITKTVKKQYPTAKIKNRTLEQLEFYY